MSGHCYICGETGGHALNCPAKAEWVGVLRPTPPASQESAVEPWRNLEPFLGADVPRNEVVLLSEVKTMCATLTAELADRNKAVIAQAGNARALADALKTLTQAARISGGVAGADINLMAACDKAENALSLTSVGCAVNAVLDVIEQRDSLRDEVERLRADAMRYRWLRDANAADLESEATFVGIDDDEGGCWIGCDLDRYIDGKMAALSASGREGE